LRQPAKDVIVVSNVFEDLRTIKMPKYSREWIEDVIVIPENVLLIFSRHDAQIARNWSKVKPNSDIFDDKNLSVF
jgi:hypothetical protein